MPGIYGIITTRRETDSSNLLGRMAERLKHHPWYVQSRYVDESAGLALGRTALGVVNADEQPVRNEDGRYLAVMEGELYDPGALRKALEAEGHAFAGASHAEILLHGYEGHGRDFLKKLNGVFAAAIWDTRERLLTLVNDRFGMKPLYYTSRPGALVFAPELKALLADPEVSRGVSARGVAQFLHFGQFLGDDTLLGSVRTLPAAAWLTYSPDDDRLSLDTYWRLDVNRGPNPTDGVQALEAIDAAFKKAVDRRTGAGHSLGLSLSGGLDSRLILGTADLERAKITTVSIGVKGSLDHVSAARMAAMVGSPHHEYYLGSDFLSNFERHMRDMVQLTDGQYLCQCIVMPSLPLYRDLGIDVLLRGHAGELMHMSKAYNFSLDAASLALRDDPSLEEWAFGRMSHWMMGAVSEDLFAGDSADLARESLRECLSESAGTEPLIHRVWHMFITQRLRRETALSMTEFGSLVETRMPYLDNDVIDALMAAPPALKMFDQIQTHILTRRRPEFLKVVNSNTGARMGAGSLERKLSTLRMKVFAKLRMPGYQPYERLGAWLREDLQPLVRRLLLKGPLLERGLLRPDAVRTMVEQHLDGRRNHTFLLLALMIFESGQRMLIDESSSDRTVEAVSGGV